jgi:hypothetical protein
MSKTSVIQTVIVFSREFRRLSDQDQNFYMPPPIMRGTIGGMSVMKVSVKTKETALSRLAPANAGCVLLTTDGLIVRKHQDLLRWKLRASLV